jgi:hypothetical protein
MRAAEPDQGIRGVREAKQAANNLEVRIQDELRGKRKLAQPCSHHQKRGSADDG